MVMTVLMSDAAESLGEECQQLMSTGVLTDLLYADDTLLLSETPPGLEKFLQAITTIGGTYGLKLHVWKFQLLRIRTQADVRLADGSVIPPQAELTYLGATIADDGRFGQELARRLGMAKTDFRELARVWKHSALSRARKIRIFDSLIVSKLLYGLATAWLNTSQRRRLDGFQNRCLRQIWGIKPAYVSRISNREVLFRTQQSPLTTLLKKQQLILFGRVARAPEDSLLRKATFCPGALRPAADRYVRKVGRPRLEWASQVYKEAVAAAGGTTNLEESLSNELRWKECVDAYCNV